jgi:hypothetical protein
MRAVVVVFNKSFASDDFAPTLFAYPIADSSQSPSP